MQILTVQTTQTKKGTDTEDYLFSKSPLTPEDMAVIQNPVIGHAKNKAGGMIFSNWRGLKVMRAVPLTVSNPKTPAQRAQRNKLATLSFMGKLIRSAYQLGYREAQDVATPWNFWISDNINTATLTDPEDIFPVIPENVKVAKGSLSPIQNISITIDTTTRSYTIDWDENQVTANDNANDKLSILFYQTMLANPIESTQEYVGYVDVKTNIADRDATTFTGFTDLAFFSGAPTYAIVFVSSVESNRVSDSTAILATLT